jgi:ribonuclease HI
VKLTIDGSYKSDYGFAGTGIVLRDDTSAVSLSGLSIFTCI